MKQDAEKMDRFFVDRQFHLKEHIPMKSMLPVKYSA